MSVFYLCNLIQIIINYLNKNILQIIKNGEFQEDYVK